jgi:hypothetical protein
MRQRLNTLTDLFCFKTRGVFRLKILFNLTSIGKHTNLAKNCSNFRLKERKFILFTENKPLPPVGTARNFCLYIDGKIFDNKTRLNKVFLWRAEENLTTPRALLNFPVGRELKGTKVRLLEFVIRFINRYVFTKIKIFCPLKNIILKKITLKKNELSFFFTNK